MLLTKENYAALLENGKRQKLVQGTDQELDPVPVVKLFTPSGGATWLLTEIDPDQPDIAFGLCDLGFGEPELGSVSLSEIVQLNGQLRLPVERDRYFTGKYPLSQYAQQAREAGRIQE